MLLFLIKSIIPAAQTSWKPSLHNASHFCAALYSGASPRLPTYKPLALLFSSDPVQGRSVPLCSITHSSSGVSLLYSIFIYLGDYTDFVLITPIASSSGCYSFRINTIYDKFARFKFLMMEVLQ